MSTHGDPLRPHVAPVGGYGLWAATVAGQFVAGSLSEAHALANARRVLEAGGGAHFLPAVEVQSFGRGVVIHRERLPRLEHRLSSVAACAETVRQRFVRVWTQHLAETSCRDEQAERVAAYLTRILSETSATEWLHWRHGPTCEVRDPLTDPWFEETPLLLRPDCCGVPTPIGETDLLAGCYRLCDYCAEIERQEAERG